MYAIGFRCFLETAFSAVAYLHSTHTRRVRWHHLTPPAFEASGPRFASRGPSSNHSAFHRAGFIRGYLGHRATASRGRLSAKRRRWRCPQLRTLMLSVAQWARSRFPRPASGGAACARGRDNTYHLARTARAGHPLRSPPLCDPEHLRPTPARAFRHRVAARGKLNRVHLAARALASPRKRDPPCLGVDGRRLRSYLQPWPDDAPRSTFGDGRGGPVTGLCNQLVVMSVRELALLPSPGLSPFDRRDRLFAS